MSLSNREIDLYVDTMIVHAIIDDHIVKRASGGSFIMPLIDKIKSYVAGKFDSGDKVKDVINFLAPGAIATLLNALGFKWLGLIMGAITSALHIDISSILSSIWNKVKSLLSSGTEITSAHIDSAVKEANQEHAPVDSGSANDHRTNAQKIRDARVVKLAMISYESSLRNKTAGLIPASIGIRALGIFTTIIGWIFKTVLASAGLMAGTDVVYGLLNKTPGKPGSGGMSGGMGSFWDKFTGKSESAPATVSVSSSQKKFPLNKSYSDVKRNTSSSNWVENGSPNEPTIESLVVSFAKEVYSGLDSLDSVIKSCSNFRNIVNMIERFNSTTQDDNGIYIPRTFTSKKQMVDYFIDEVAAKAQ
jgi:hypothetical protein